ncbi:MAG: gamma-glutamyl-gamma-aminobutyrate hydrolase family protein [Pseudomonadota bacterium]
MPAPVNPMTAEEKTRRPVIGILCDGGVWRGHPYHMTGHKYVWAIQQGCEAVVFLIPALGTHLTANLTHVFNQIDGLVLTGNTSHVPAACYGGTDYYPVAERCLVRDETHLAVIKQAIKANLPMLGICRGMQEINVALGGTLQAVDNHVPSEPLDPQDLGYGLAHEVQVRGEGLTGRLEQVFGKPWVRVNSYHAMAIDRLGQGLVLEACADDGIIEAISHTSAPVFAVQWHPEWRFWQDEVSRALFADFGARVRAVALARRCA